MLQNDQNNQKDGLQRIIVANEIVIFGTGYVAESFWYGLERMELTSRVSCFVVSETAKEKEQFHSRPVYSLHDAVFYPDMIVCLAVHSTLAEKLLPILNDIIPDRVIWIYPFLHEIIYGKPVKNTIPVDRNELLRKQDSSFNWISVRYLAARDYYYRAEDYKSSSDTYIKAMSAHCSYSTAKERLRNLEKLTDAMLKIGFDYSFPILVDSRHRIIDGLHRIAVASVLNIETIPCNIVPVSEAYDYLLSDRNKLPDPVLYKAGLSSEQIEKLAKAKQELIRNTMQGGYEGNNVKK